MIFEQRLLHALAGNITRNRWIVRLAGNLIDLVDEYDPAFGSGGIVFRGLNETQKDVLHILTHIAGFRQGRGVGNAEGNPEDTRERARQQRLAAPRRPDEKHIALAQLHVFVLFTTGHALIVVVDRNRQHLLRVLLADHILVQELVDFSGA